MEYLHPKSQTMSGDSTPNSVTVQSTVSLINDLKFVQTFKINLEQYTLLKKDEEKQEFLLLKMKENIAGSLKGFESLQQTHLKSH